MSGDFLKEQFKIKSLTKEQIIISVDRLTRFKSTEDKYLRVFKEIILSNLISPKFKKSELDVMDYSQLAKIVEDIFQVSLTSLNIHLSEDFAINKKLLEYEKSVFKFDKNVEKLLNNKIDYLAVIKLFEDEKLPLNLKWLASLSQSGDSVSNRANLGLKFPIEKIIIVEGITEEILLPKFAKICGLDFDKAGINLISAGGKNQVVKLFYMLSDILKLPIFVLMDSDAQDNYEEIKPKLREKDSVYILKSGEFEDVLPLNLIKRTLNQYFRNYSSFKLEDLRENEQDGEQKSLPMTKILEELFKSRGFEFKKAEFAMLVGNNIKDLKDVSAEIEIIISKLGAIACSSQPLI